MAATAEKITALPTRYEPLVRVLGDKAKTTFVPCKDDLDKAKRLVAATESAGQGKFCFIEAASGTGKSTFVHSLETLMSDKVGQVIRLPQPYELKLADIPGYVAGLPRNNKVTVVNFDNREAPFFSPPEYQTFLGELNGVLRSRPDLLVYWPVTDGGFAKALVELLGKVGGRSAFGPEPILLMSGLKKEQYLQVLVKLLQVANWQLEDAAIDKAEVETLVTAARRSDLHVSRSFWSLDATQITSSGKVTPIPPTLNRETISACTLSRNSPMFDDVAALIMEL